MIHLATDTTKLQTKLVENKYFELHPSLQRIIQLFSVIYAPIDKNSFVSCLSKTGALDENNKPWSTKTLSPKIDKLLKAGLLMQESRQGAECHPLLTEIATRHAIKTEQFEIQVIAVEEKLPIRTHWNHDSRRIFHSLRQCIREIRIGFYRQDPNFINKQIEDYEKYGDSEEKIVIQNIFEQICNNPFDADWLSTLPQGLYESSISSILLNSALKLSVSEDAYKNSSMDSNVFEVFIKECLLPKLWSGAVVVMDNVPAHKKASIEILIQSVGASVLNLSPYSPDFNPIEHWWSQLKAFLRQFSPKTTKMVDTLIAIALNLFNPRHLRNWFANCCYCTS
ncbi:transposase [Nostoc sp.]